MKSTGVVRRIDELGRIVIPKEIRRNLNINDNEEVEIFVDGENIILKKYYRLMTLKETAQKYIEILEKLITSPLIITDRDKIILSSKETYTIYINQNISKILSDYITDRKNINDKGKLIVTSNLTIEGNYIVIPIVVNGDAIGSFVCFNNEIINEKTMIIVEIINILLKSQLEN
jgi:stage V sporulation protein T